MIPLFLSFVFALSSASLAETTNSQAPGQIPPEAQKMLISITRHHLDFLGDQNDQALVRIESELDQQIDFYGQKLSKPAAMERIRNFRELNPIRRYTTDESAAVIHDKGIWQGDVLVIVRLPFQFTVGSSSHPREGSDTLICLWRVFADQRPPLIEALGTARHAKGVSD